MEATMVVVVVVVVVIQLANNITLSPSSTLRK